MGPPEWQPPELAERLARSRPNCQTGQERFNAPDEDRVSLRIRCWPDPYQDLEEMSRLIAFCLLVGGTACSVGGTQPRAGSSVPPKTQAPAARVPTPAPTPPLPPYFIESLRARAYPGGKLAVGE